MNRPLSIRSILTPVAVLLVASLFSTGCGAEEAAAERLQQRLDAGEDLEFLTILEVLVVDDDEPVESTMTLAQRPPKWRLDGRRDDGKVGVSIWDGEHWIDCTSARKMCTEYVYEAGEPDLSDAFFLDPEVDFLEQLSEDELDVEELPAREFLGISAACFHAESEFNDVRYAIEICVSADGLILYYDWLIGNDDPLQIHVETTDVSYAVPSGYFEPPYPVNERITIPPLPSPITPPAQPSPATIAP
jgi:hypothetical protein